MYTPHTEFTLSKLDLCDSPPAPSSLPLHPYFTFSGRKKRVTLPGHPKKIFLKFYQPSLLNKIRVVHFTPIRFIRYKPTPGFPPTPVPQTPNEFPLTKCLIFTLALRPINPTSPPTRVTLVPDPVIFPDLPSTPFNA